MTGPAVDARPADDLRAGSGVAAPGGVGHRPHRAERRDGRGAVVPRHRHVARSVRARRSSRRSRRITSAIASGTIRVVGELYNPDALRIDTDDRAGRTCALLDYRLRNEAPIRLSVERQIAAGRRAAAGRRRHRARPDRVGQPRAIKRWRCRPTARRTSRCCRDSCPTCAARAAPKSPRASAARRPRRWWRATRC